MTRPPDDQRPIVVGIDPDPAKRMALAWAADEAARRAVPLRLVHAEGVPTPGYEVPSWQEWNQALHEAGERVLKDAVSFAETRQPRVEVSGLLAEGSPAWVLGEQSHGATAVVLGSQHLGRLEEAFGSASIAVPVLAHSRCPVVVVPEPERIERQSAYYVVGVDGSPQAAAAVDVAFAEAALRGAALRALHVWQPGPLRITDEQEAQREWSRILSEAVAGRGAAYHGVEVHQEVVVGHPVQALTEASADALGLVVGTRGHGGFTGMLVGSVSQGVLRHARCPVIAVPQPPERAPRERP
ncbi:universal stress protein [Streptomyces nodosus]|uniref:universal stress protein n=1 Tax=Streptomyces nodosus TaxID=40318 RepID=UPI0037F3D74E